MVLFSAAVDSISPHIKRFVVGCLQLKVLGPWYARGLLTGVITSPNFRS